MPNFRMRRTLAAAILALPAAAISLPASANDAYPSRPIRLVVPFAAGSGTDAVARITAKELGDALNQNVIVDNRPGANGSIAAEIVAQAAPDGYTLFMTTNTTHSANPSLMKKLPYDPIKDFTPVARMGNLPFMLVINPKLPVKTVGELIAYAKSHPDMSYASGNSTGIVSGATLARMAHVDLLHVPYKSTPPAMTDVIAGQVPMMFVDVAAGIANVKAGRMRALAVTTAQRSRLLPDLPPIGDTPELKGFDITSWNGVFAPAKTPQPIVDRLNRELSKIAASKEVAPKFEALGFEAFGQTPQQFAGFVGSELVKWNKLVKDAGIQPE
ncbi:MULTISPECIES: Bug family tripartite tricarboxylate transporter substrate binding protein [Cupriavidus]|jgi:tripartite-type tricarboxylate transporter receptor subunit TctC|uniref:Tripartite tricarboxylate transporter substrate binding protein n=1 Tax=Cupriavidus metallidurans TaxID=119219 RepID=A0A2L0X351_9BURK|nr:MULTISPECIES: tripartite tricarboxylate transporter substrate binding protein [Cupriavidus]AVA34544.1 tripartite tricarboxylate transporter substrate binding protein [Cupriavidus metallidurans]KWR82598.1 ABC transporter substrate-binding protein [Cupriavidus sp. SHE]QBP12406.1 tripartite tricarboxylate transporter substrate binding protein [Cupriavidus metallidurans]QWC92354.1 tripartite tricarboxylate transporter substrate binding protein [Cupriavidus metallidurans]